MGCAKSKQASDDGLNRKNAPPPASTNKREPGSASTVVPAPVPVTSAPRSRNSSRKQPSQSSTLSADNGNAAPVKILSTIETQPNSQRGTTVGENENAVGGNENAAEPDSDGTSPALMALGALATAAGLYMFADPPMSVAPAETVIPAKEPVPPAGTCDPDAQKCGSCVIRKADNLRYAYPNKRHVWVKDHQDLASLNTHRPSPSQDPFHAENIENQNSPRGGQHRPVENNGLRASLKRFQSPTNPKRKGGLKKPNIKKLKSKPSSLA